MRVADEPAYSVNVYIGGDWEQAREALQDYVDDVGLCVTVTPTEFVYTGGCEPGIVVGLVNYPRFPSNPTAIWHHAEAIAHRLLDDLHQDTALIQSVTLARWLTRRKIDCGG